MTFKSQACALLAVGALSVSGVHAQDAAGAVEGAVDAVIQGWSGTATLGLNNTTGNSESSNISGSIRLGRTVGRWEHLVFGSVFKGSSTIVREEINDDGTPALDPITNQPIREIIRGDNSDRLSLGYQPRFYWRPRTYFFGILDYEQDEPAGIESSTRQVVGVGHKFYSNASGFFSGEAGFGNKVTTATDGGEDVTGAIGYLGLNNLNRINDNVTLTADLRTDLGSDNTFYEAGAGLAFKLSQRLALKIAHFVRGNTDLEDPTNPLSSASDSVTDLTLVLDI